MPPVIYGLIALFGQFRFRKRFMDVIPMLAVLMLCWNAIDAPDNDSYMKAYNNLEREKYYRGFGIGFKLVINVFRSLGFNYRFFKLFIVLITLVITEIVLIYLTADSWLVWSYYLVFPALYTYIQIRNALALSIVAAGLAVIVKHVKYGELYCMLCIAVAYTIHSTCVLFFVIPVLSMFAERTVAIVASVIAVLNFLTMPVLPQFAALLFSQKKVNYYMIDNAADPLDRVLITVTVLLNIAVLLYIRWRSAEHTPEFDAVFKISLAFLSLLPVLMYNKDFLRLDRVIVLFVYIAMANYFVRFEQRIEMQSRRIEAESSLCVVVRHERMRYWAERFSAMLVPVYLFMYLVFPAIRQLPAEVFGSPLLLSWSN